MSWLILGFVLLLNHATLGQQDGDEMSLMDIINATEQLSEFGKVLRYYGHHQVFLDRPITLLAPTNEAMLKYKGKRGENLALNHMINVAIFENQMQESLVSLVTGSPNLWITKDRSPIDGQDRVFVNQAEIIQSDIQARSSRGDQQIMHVINSVLEPLVPISLRESSQYMVNLNAKKLLSKSTLYDLSGFRLRIFNGQSDLNQKTHMFGVPGQHTFFLPIDSAFNVNVQLTGYDYERNNVREKIPGARINKDLVDASVVESHIVPHRLLFTSHAPTDEYQTVAWLEDGVKVNVSLQPASIHSSNDPTILNYEKQFQSSNNRDSFVYNKYEQEDHENPTNDARYTEAPVMVRSNTIIGDRFHANGMVVARIVKGNIPVSNGVVHLIDKPLMIVARSLYEYVSEEGRLPGNRLSKFAKLLRDKGGKFAEALFEAKDGTILAPSDEAFEKVDKERLDFIIGNDYLRAEMLGLHFVRERITSTDRKIQGSDDMTYSVPASLAANRVWFYFNPRDLRMTIAARGINATIVEKDIGTINGVVHVIDRVLGVPYQSVYERLSTDPNMSHMWSMLVQTRLDRIFSQAASMADTSYTSTAQRGPKFTLIVPSNSAWEKAQMNFNKAYNTLLDGQIPQYTLGILKRHLKIDERPYTFEELVEMTRSSPQIAIDMMQDKLEFTQLGEFQLSAYKENHVTLHSGIMNGEKSVRAKVVRPNIECTDGYIHIIDTALIDDAPPWTILANQVQKLQTTPSILIIMTILSVLALL